VRKVYGCRQWRRRKRLGAGTTSGLSTADAPNRLWAVDFQFAATTDGRRIKIVSIIDELIRECLGRLVERSITADVLIDDLDRLATQRTYPVVLRCDNTIADKELAVWEDQLLAHRAADLERIRHQLVRAVEERYLS